MVKSIKTLSCVGIILVADLIDDFFFAYKLAISQATRLRSGGLGRDFVQGDVLELFP